jgi:adenylate cyclase
MGREIERKFLVHRDLWRPDPALGVRYRQGYLSTDPARVVRVRTVGDSGFLTVKGPTKGIERYEFEHPIPRADADAMLDMLCIRPLIEKIRYRVPFGGRLWEVDVFSGDNAGLIVAEVELPSADSEIIKPGWAADEVSDDPRYFNSNLSKHPYKEWGS